MFSLYFIFDTLCLHVIGWGRVVSCIQFICQEPICVYQRWVDVSWGIASFPWQGLITTLMRIACSQAPVTLFSFLCQWIMYICVSLTCGSCRMHTGPWPLILKGNREVPQNAWGGCSTPRGVRKFIRICTTKWSAASWWCIWIKCALRYDQQYFACVKGFTYMWRGGTGEGS